MPGDWLKFVLAILAAFALLLAGCASAPASSSAAAGGEQSPQATQAQPPASPQGVPPAPEGVQAPPQPPSAMEEPLDENLEPEAAPPAPVETGSMTITFEELAAHNGEEDCWVGYDGEAYDITAFIPNHKNYQALIVPLCGKVDEFKNAFEGKHNLTKVDVLRGQPLMGNLGQ